MIPFCALSEHVAASANLYIVPLMSFVKTRVSTE